MQYGLLGPPIKTLGRKPLRAGLRWLLVLVVVLGLSLPSLGNVSTGQAAPVFTGLEIFAAEEPVEVPVPLHPNPKADNTEVPAGLPAGSIALFIVMGVVDNVDGAGQEWRIGNPPVFVYTSAGTRIDNAPKKGDVVKVVANRTLAPGPIVAERITRRQLGPFPVGAAEVELAFLFAGLVTEAGNHIWKIGGLDFIVDDAEFPAEIDPGLGKGSTVIVEFIATETAAPPPGGGVPPPGGGGTFIGLEIFAAEEPVEVPVPLHPNPKTDNTAVPAGLPAGSIALVIVMGVVDSVDGAGQEWRIGNPPVFVYTSAGTRIDNAPKKGDLVKVVANRTLAPGPIVAERITRRQLGPFPVGAAELEMAFLFSGLVSEAGNHIWIIGGHNFIVDDLAFPAEIDPGLGKGSTVIVEFAPEVAP